MDMWQEILERVEIDLVTGCWNWMRGKTQDGYGMFQGDSAHRHNYRVWIGEIPTGYDLDHTCENRGCCCPWHLVPTTHTDNIRKSGVTKLSQRDLDTIRRDHTDSDYNEVARFYGVTPQTIARVVNDLEYRTK